ncbi:hypothetical protein HNR06_002155 [Nocardiopsis arvandica]|uniref:Uncharacterized protein n=1 Tax=Nocardiopsis sinuspersici TaxID=501010 RepID=A0A7Y9XB76_9ACTN|nr:hypothetical protein [Nocardiopsis sinuspersici]NYH52566.1 hypothetical protein [Nocardiopsis sinuspersici]
MSPAPVSTLMCALLLCGPAQPGGGPSPCVAAAAAASPTAAPGDPKPCATPSARSRDSRPSEPPGGAARHTAAAPPPVDGPVAHRTAAAPGPVGTALRVVGNVSTGILLVLCVAVLAMRLPVGWPRFPTPYEGRRRRGSVGRASSPGRPPPSPSPSPSPSPDPAGIRGAAAPGPG